MSEASGMSSPGPRVAVPGGSGAVGEGIVRRLVESGASVAVIGRSAERIDEMADRLGRPERLVAVPAGLDDDAAWRAAATRAAEALGGLDAVVASLGSWWSGAAVVDIPAAEWDRILDDRLGAHVRSARAFLPLLRGERDAAYVLVNGSGAEEPVRGSGPVNVAAAGQLMLARVLDKETPGVRVHSLVVATPVITRTRPQGRSGWLTADEVGDAVVGLVSGAGSRAVVQRLVGAGAMEDVP